MALLNAERSVASTDERPLIDHSERRRWLDAVVLVIALFGLSFTISADAYSSTDVGGKTAAVQAMVDRGDWNTDIGYWAEDLDPEGAAHPFYGTTRMPNGWWVNTTSIPMVIAAKPLWAMGGARGVLLLPIVGAALTALAASRLSRRFYGGSGRMAFWVVGLTTPITIYAMEFWEHTLGAALMMWGVAWTVDASRAGRVLPASMAGLAFGAASTMRQEALVYGAVAGAVLVAGAALSTRRRPARGLRTILTGFAPSAAMAVTALSMMVGYTLLERWYYGGSFRGGRSLGTASAAGNALTDRAQAAWATTFAPLNTYHSLTYVLGGLLLVSLLWCSAEIARDRSVRLPAMTLAAVALVLALRTVANGPTFVPGLAAVAPITVVGAVLVANSRRWQLLALAVGPLPLVWLSQYPSGALPQWGGRYILVTGILLVVAGLGELSQRKSNALVGLVAMGLAATVSGLWWSSVRAEHLVSDFGVIESVADGDVVVWYDPFKAREAGPIVLDQRWLSTYGGVAVAEVESVLSGVGVDRFLWIDRVREQPAVFDGYERVEAAERIELSPILGADIMIFERVND